MKDLTESGLTERKIIDGIDEIEEIELPSKKENLPEVSKYIPELKKEEKPKISQESKDKIRRALFMGLICLAVVFLISQIFWFNLIFSNKNFSANMTINSNPQINVPATTNSFNYTIVNNIDFPEELTIIIKNATR